MSILRRYHTSGNIYFITNVTYDRQPILNKYAPLLTRALDTARNKEAFEIMAWVIMPEHFHLVIDPLSWDISRLLQTVKMSFGALFRKQTNLKRGRVWQNRFWDHIIRNQGDLNRHIDYVHYNPVKHRLAQSPFDWELSSIHEYHRQGFYQNDWGRNEINWGGQQFGE